MCDEYFVCEELDEAVASFFELADPHFTNVRTFSELATGNAATSRLTSRNGNACNGRERSESRLLPTAAQHSTLAQVRETPKNSTAAADALLAFAPRVSSRAARASCWLCCGECQALTVLWRVPSSVDCAGCMGRNDLNQFATVPFLSVGASLSVVRVCLHCCFVLAQSLFAIGEQNSRPITPKIAQL